MAGERTSRPSKRAHDGTKVKLGRMSEVKRAGKPRRNVTAMRRHLVNRRLARRPY